MLSGMVKEITGSYIVEYHPEGPDGPVKKIDFTRPWKRIDMIKVSKNGDNFNPYNVVCVMQMYMH